ncbi:response regulator [Dictyobacter kobayashii]|uniref:Response regulatory domain-containing protein n=1 Tax=Dictyobacter kobayashii TaxID=2014872 RepID=A0A402ALG8_9CHLR|nr:response regulator [Dictyobacter kobayashii]GCE19953.1 hypothetical protein KDK_37530 [Dictyobacter kobayashii]
MVTTPKVLIIDDSPTQCLYMQQALQGAGYQVLVANDGPQGLRMIAQDPPQCLVLDIILPGMNGFEVCRHLRSQEALRSLPIIIISSKNASSDRFWAMRQGANFYLVKPFKGEELVQAVMNVVPEAPRQPNTSIRPNTGSVTGPQRPVNPNTPLPASGWGGKGSQQPLRPQTPPPMQVNNVQDTGNVQERGPQNPQFASFRYSTMRAAGTPNPYPQGNNVQVPGQQPQSPLSETGPQQPIRMHSMRGLPLLIPRRVEGTDGPQISNLEHQSVADYQLRQLYQAIDGQKNIEELSVSVQMNKEEIISALRILILQQRILLYEPGGRLVDSSFL